MQIDSKFWKGIFLMFSVIYAAMQGTGEIMWTYTLSLAVLTGVAYYVKNYWIAQSVSVEGAWDWRDFMSGLVLAVVAALIDSLGSIIVGKVIYWHELGKLVLSVFGTYMLTTFGFGPAKAAKSPSSI